MSSAVIHAVFHCTQCKKEWDDFLTAQKLAHSHAVKSGHRVEGEVAKVVIYDGKKLKGA